MKTVIAKNYVKLGERAAEIVAEQVNQKPDSVLGLATGTTVIGMYNKLVEMHKKGQVDFSQVKTFNLDEYWPMKKTDVQSYHYFMKTFFFDHVNIKPENIHIPDGELEKDQISQFCKNYEEEIRKVGGVDLQILGIGGGYYTEKRQYIGGHVGFNEAKSEFDSRTRLVKLSEQTRSDNSRFFRRLENVPYYAITMGLGTIMEAKQLVLLAFGDSKSSPVKEALEGPVNNLVPASVLQRHPQLTVVVDEGAGAKLRKVSSPWLVKQIDWSKELSKLKQEENNLIENAVVWLSTKTGKAIGELTLSDYRNNHLSGLAKIYENQVNDVGGQVLERLDSRIVSEKDLPANKKIMILSPHPDDDVISVGGTINYLKEKRNDVTVIYMVSGNIAVRNEDVIQYLDEHEDEDGDLKSAVKSGDIEFEKLLDLKAKVRESEAKLAAGTIGVPEKDLIFLRSPFYETGLIIKREIKQSDWQPLVELFEKEKPDIIVVPGESADPHGTHGKCIEIFWLALNNSRFGSVELWHYRGGWEEYTVSEADKIVPLSEDVMKQKIEAIKQHKSQLDPVFGGLDPRPFWKRAKDRNRHSGKMLEIMGASSKPYAELFRTETAKTNLN
ncbi:MAG TPA: glucosamine-6-phosphate deaminase [Candidatus Bathyarchaeota archaeon]|nr:glucosamine-6-phosphate deaminase [Candidatus Bathyarchaeota archaeon]